VVKHLETNITLLAFPPSALVSKDIPVTRAFKMGSSQPKKEKKGSFIVAQMATFMHFFLLQVMASHERFYS